MPDHSVSDHVTDHGETDRSVTVLSGARVVTPEGVLDPGWVTVFDGRISAVGAGTRPHLPAPPTAGGPAWAGHGSDGSVRSAEAGAPTFAGVPTFVDLAGAWLVPGFIDLHMHGGGGHDVTAGIEAMADAVAFHRAHGTTRTLVSLVAAPLDRLVEQLGWIADLAGRGAPSGGHVIGAHLEGPFLARARCGAQPPEHLRDPDRRAFADLVTAARGTLRYVTVAPELPGAGRLVTDVVAAGAVAAVGHTDADYEAATAAFDAGASLATHLFNGMRSFHHREPGPVGAALDAGAACEMINDGVHLHPAAVRLVARDPHQLVLVTDAVDSAGMGDGDYFLGGQAVRVRAGAARLAASGVLAGSTLTMDRAFRRAVVDCGLPVELAAAAAATNPARVLGLSQACGAIAAGLAADLVVLDPDLRVVQVMVGGEWSQTVPTGLAGGGTATTDPATRNKRRK